MKTTDFGKITKPDDDGYCMCFSWVCISTFIRAEYNFTNSNEGQTQKSVHPNSTLQDIFSDAEEHIYKEVQRQCWNFSRGCHSGNE